MGDGEGTLTAAEAAIAMGVGRSTARRLFDASGGAAGFRDPVTGERRFDPEWVRARVRRTRTVLPGVSVAEASRRLGVSPNTVRAWFDRDAPASGERIDNGRTGEDERRCDEAWIERLRTDLERPEPPS